MLGIVFCTDGIFPYQIGGMQRHSRKLIESLAKNEIQIVVVHPHNESIFNDFDNIVEYHVKGIDISKKYLIESYYYSKRVFEIISKYPDYIVYSQGLSVWFNSSLLKNRLIVNPHGLEPFQSIGFKNKIISIPFKFIFTKIFKNSKYVVSLGGILTEICGKIISDSSKIRVIPNAVNVSDKIFERNFENKKTRVLFFARFASNKGIDVLFKAIDELEKTNDLQNFEFTLAGTGPLYKHFLDLNKRENVKLIGFVKDEDVETLYEQNDLFVLPTLFEGMPTVVLEAMSKKLPIIVTNVGATSSMVNTKNGFLIERNSVVQLVDALKKFNLLSETEKNEMSNASFHKVVNNFTWKIVGEQHLDLFKNLNKV